MLTKITSYNKTRVLSTLQGGGNGGPRGGGFLGASTPATHACPPQSRLSPKQLSPRARPAQLAAKAIQSLRNHCQHTRFPGPKNIKPQIWKNNVNFRI